MVEVNIRDQNFGGEPSSCHKGVNKHVKWCFDNKPVSDTCFITDMCLNDIHKASGVKRKVAWLLEPRAIHPHIYDWIEHKVSIIASGKNTTEGHQLRHKVIDRFKYNIGVYGYGYKPVENKEESLSEYMYSITIENCRQKGYWTEKIVDCFATKTIPIFWGDDAVNDFFDSDGIIYFNDVKELGDILKDLENNGEKIYNSKKAAIEKNFNLVETYRIPEDWMYLNYPFLFK